MARAWLPVPLLAIAVLGCGSLLYRSGSARHALPAIETLRAEMSATRCPGDDVDPGVWAGARYEDYGEGLRGLRIPAADAQSTAIVWHGQGEHHAAPDNLCLGGALASRGIAAFLAEYRGHAGLATPSVSESGLYADARAALAHVRATSDGPIVLVGFSLGASVAVQVAAESGATPESPPRVRGLVLIAPFTSMASEAPYFASHRFPVLTPTVPVVRHLRLGRLLGLDDYPTEARIRDVTLPTFVIYGADDDVVPAWMPERVIRARRECRVLQIPERDHDDLRSGSADAIAAWTRDVLGSPAP